jgi:hypothetical protein
MVCKRVFEAETVAESPIEVWIASVNAVHCPKCGAGACRLGFGGAFGDAPPLTKSIEIRAAWWKRRGDVGVSSETIWATLLVGHRIQNPDIPHDPDDFSRCRALLVLIPEWRSQLSLVSDRYPWWKPFVDAWDELDVMFTEEDSRQWKKPNRMYKRMQALKTESRRMRQGERMILEEPR